MKSSEAGRVARRYLQAVIRKEKGQYCVRSPDNPKWNGGCYDTKAEAEKRLKQVEFFSDDPMRGNRMQSLSSCTHEHCLPYGLYSILTHEVTHAAESMFRLDPTYYRGPGVVDETAYVNDPGEVRAFMQQVGGSSGSPEDTSGLR